jgi:HSP20 family protein
MARDLIRLMHSLFLPAASACGEVHWRPSADIYRTRDGWLVKFDLAGVRPEDIELTAQGSRLTVCGRRRDCCIAEGYRYYRMEIAYSHFERSLELPCQLDPARITSEFRDGMLLVRIETEEGKS